MRKKQKAALLLPGILALTMIVSGCSGAGREGTLKVGVREDIVGLGHLNPVTEKYYGLEIDIAEIMAQDMGYGDVEFVTVQPENRKKMLQKGDVDCLIAAYSISDKRLKNFDFSAPYYVDQIQVMIQNSALFKGLEDLKGKTIGVLSGVNTAVVFATKMNEMGLIEEFDSTTFEADTYVGGLTFKSFESYNELSRALEEGQVDAVCMDGSIAKGYMNEERSILDVTLTEQEYGVATQKGSTLSKKVKKSVQKLLDDGSIDKLMDKWD